MLTPLSSSATPKIAQSALTITVQTDKAYYLPDQIVKMSGIAKNFTNDPIADATVSIEVKDPRNNTIFLDIVFTASNGTYQDDFRLHSEAIFGKYHVYITANALGYPTTQNQTTFTVGTPPTPVGGIWIPVNKLSLLAPYIGLTILLVVAVVTVVFFKHKKRKT